MCFHCKLNFILESHIFYLYYTSKWEENNKYFFLMKPSYTCYKITKINSDEIIWKCFSANICLSKIKFIKFIKFIELSLFYCNIIFIWVPFANISSNSLQKSSGYYSCLRLRDLCGIHLSTALAM